MFMSKFRPITGQSAPKWFFSTLLIFAGINILLVYLIKSTAVFTPKDETFSKEWSTNLTSQVDKLIGSTSGLENQIGNIEKDLREANKRLDSPQKVELYAAQMETALQRLRNTVEFSQSNLDMDLREMNKKLDSPQTSQLYMEQVKVALDGIRSAVESGQSNIGVHLKAIERVESKRDRD